MLPSAPTKYAELSESLLGLGAVFLDKLSDEPHSIDDLYGYALAIYPELIFEYAVFTLDLLFAFGAITLGRDGRIMKCA